MKWFDDLYSNQKFKFRLTLRLKYHQESLVGGEIRNSAYEVMKTPNKNRHNTPSISIWSDWKRKWLMNSSILFLQTQTTLLEIRIHTTVPWLSIIRNTILKSTTVTAYVSSSHPQGYFHWTILLLLLLGEVHRRTHQHHLHQNHSIVIIHGFNKPQTRGVLHYHPTSTVPIKKNEQLYT